MSNVKVEFPPNALHRGIREPLALEAFNRARKLVQRAIHAIDTGEQVRYREWFDGGNSPSRRHQVRANFGQIHDALDGRPVVLAVATATNRFALADPNSPLFIWPLNLNGVILDTMMFELSHKTANAPDLAYGPANCADLAESNPDKAIANADCYFYFALSGARPVRATD